MVAAADDLVGAGIVASLARPGGNKTGLSLIDMDISAKQMELLKAFPPKTVARCRVVEPGRSSHPALLKRVQPGGARRDRGRPVILPDSCLRRTRCRDRLGAQAGMAKPVPPNFQRLAHRAQSTKHFEDLIGRQAVACLFVDLPKRNALARSDSRVSATRRRDGKRGRTSKSPSNAQDHVILRTSRRQDNVSDSCNLQFVLELFLSPLRNE